MPAPRTAHRILDALLGMREADAAEEMDPTVQEYVEGLIEESLEAGSDGLDELFESCSDFIPGFSTSQEQFRAILESEGQADPPAPDSPPPQDATPPPAAPPPAAHAGPAAPPAHTRAAHSMPSPKQQAAAARSPARPPKAEGGLGGGVVCKSLRKPTGVPTSVEEEVSFLLSLAGASVDDPTILAYLSSVARDTVAEAGVIEDLVDVFCGLVPELQALDHPRDEAFGYFFERVCALHEEEARAKAVSAAGASGVQPSGGAKVEECVEEEEVEEEEEEDEEDWTGASEQVLTLREVFATATRAELEAALALSGHDMEAAIERVVQMIEFQEIAVSAEARRVEAQTFEQEATEAARERALARYNIMSEVCKSESGKKGVNVDKVIRVRDAAIEHSIKKMMESTGPQRRYVNNEVVAHKGERFLYVKPEKKLKNSVTEDPSTFIGLKVKGKGKRGPSPKFK